MTVYVSLAQVQRLHHDQIRVYGGDAGLRDPGLLESALARPAATFDGEDLYPDLPSKAAALMHSLVLNHPFVDGNKRVGAQAAIVFIIVNGWDFLATADELVEVTIDVAAGKIEIEALGIWFRHRTRPVD